MNDPNEKLQIRLTRAALERLIAGDPELEIAFHDNALKQILEDKRGIIQKKVQEFADAAFEAAFGGYVKESSGRWNVPDKTVFRISQAAREAINEYVKEQVSYAVKDYLQTRCVELSKMLREVLDVQLQKEIERRAGEQIKAIVDNAVKRMKENL